MKATRSTRLLLAAGVALLAIVVQIVVHGQDELNPFERDTTYVVGQNLPLVNVLSDPPRLFAVTIGGRLWLLTPDVEAKIVEANAVANKMSKAFESSVNNQSGVVRIDLFPSADKRAPIASTVSNPLIEDLAYPRFQQADVGPATVATIVPAATTLLVPFAVRDLGFDTGITLANTLADPFGFGLPPDDASISRDGRSDLPAYCKPGVKLEVSIVDATGRRSAIVKFTNDGACDATPESLTPWMTAGTFGGPLNSRRPQGQVVLLFQPNTTGKPRVGAVLIGDQVLTVTQDAHTTDPDAVTITTAKPTSTATITAKPSAPDPGAIVTLTLGIGDGKPVPSVTLNPEPIQTAPPSEREQNAVLSYMDNAVLMIRSVPSPSVDWKGVLAALVSPIRPRLASAAIAGPRAPAWRRQTSAAPMQDAPRIKVFVTSLGQLGANAFRVVVVNDGGAPVALRLRDIALEPVSRLTEKDVQRELASLARLPQRAITVAGYCLQREKTAPAAGVVYRVASADAQAKNAPVSRVLQAAQRLRDRKALTPDTDPDEYYHSIVQWAIWTTQEKFDRRAFDAAFVTHARKNVVGAGERWSREIEDAVKEIAPHRWRDVSKVVDEARKDSPKE
jgi:hypothetical protein